ncbi:hypothetical protein [Neoaquamicrobium sediminum]|uniref:hypothetical protein n=1 Tax=Neoaquamicrobium sediminum TaxID=1849104 RepID=UPI001567AD39|nr:hypothetical protein [Mesorhizobium sediminum]NRC54176.1 hypothetical protein [Mesorhizobium sediminum]
MTTYIPHLMPGAKLDMEARPVVINIKVEDRVSPAFRKTPRTPEYIAMIENIERAEPLPPALGDILERMKAQILERFKEKLEDDTLRHFGLQPYQREAVAVLERGEATFPIGRKGRKFFHTGGVFRP